MALSKSQTRPADAPWIFRTYSGHSAAAASNALYRSNLAKGQTGLSIAFDLPTQTGYDSDHILSRGEVGKVGVPIAHVGDMRALFEGIPLERMNTSMTINATAPWLLALYIAAAQDQGAAPEKLQGTTQNDIIKEYLSRGTHIFPPEPSMRLITDMIGYTYRQMPKWNPVNVCSYHLQEAGATPVQELAFALANAIAILDHVKAQGDIPQADFPQVVGRISFFVNAGIKFITELSKMRAFAEMWEEITATRYGVEDPKFRRFRYGVQVNSLGLTEQQPENNVYRILLEMLAVVLSKNARARAVQLPAWNEALGLPHKWDQQWSLRMQQIVAFETDLLETDDIFDGSTVIAAKVNDLKKAAYAELARIDEMGGALAAIDSSYMKQQLVVSNAARLMAIESGAQAVVGVNAFTETEPSPLAAAGAEAVMSVGDEAEDMAIAGLKAWRAARDGAAVTQALAALKQAATTGANIMPPSIAAAKAGVTTGEWAQTLRAVFGEYRAPTGVEGRILRALVGDEREDLETVRRRVDEVSEKLGRRLTMLVGKPGLDGHSNGAEQIAMRAAACGMEVHYDGIRLTPEEIVSAAKEQKAHVVGLSILSGSHVSLVRDVMGRLRAAGLSHVPVIVGGIIPQGDVRTLRQIGVSKVYTPKDFQLTPIMADVVELVAKGAG